MTEQTKTIYKHPKTLWIAKEVPMVISKTNEEIVKYELRDKIGKYITYVDTYEELKALGFILPEDQVMGEQEGDLENQLRSILCKMVKIKGSVLEEAKAIIGMIDNNRSVVIEDLPKPTEGCNVSSSVVDNKPEAILVAECDYEKCGDNIIITEQVLNKFGYQKHLGASVSTPSSKVREEIIEEVLQLLIARSYDCGERAANTEEIEIKREYISQADILSMVCNEIEQLKTQQPPLDSK